MFLHRCRCHRQRRHRRADRVSANHRCDYCAAGIPLGSIRYCSGLSRYSYGSRLCGNQYSKQMPLLCTKQRAHRHTGFGTVVGDPAGCRYRGYQCGQCDPCRTLAVLLCSDADSIRLPDPQPDRLQQHILQRISNRGILFRGCPTISREKYLKWGITLDKQIRLC